MDPAKPRSMADRVVRTARGARVHAEGHVVALNRWVQEESTKRQLSMPWFDPDDAGEEARVLFLLESPGPMADAGKGSGFISVDNDDPTAENLWRFRRRAGLTSHCVHWNAVPWYIPGGKISAADEKRCLELLRRLLPYLPVLEVVVPMGRVAQRVWATFSLARPNQLAVFPTWHPSALGLTQAARADHVQHTLVKVATLLQVPPLPRPGLSSAGTLVERVDDPPTANPILRGPSDPAPEPGGRKERRWSRGWRRGRAHAEPSANPEAARSTTDRKGLRRRAEDAFRRARPKLG